MNYNGDNQNKIHIYTHLSHHRCDNIYMFMSEFTLSLRHNTHPSDAVFMYKIRRMRMQICRVINISTSCYSCCDWT